MRLALDFDGVFWDSVGECYVTARKAYNQLYGTEAPQREQAFRSGRWLARVGSDFGLLLELTREHDDLSRFPKAEWERQRAEFPRSKEFEGLFYRIREEARNHDFATWVSSQGPYPGFLEELPALRAHFGDPAIATTKDAASVAALLAPLGLKLTVLGREFSTDKKLQIGHLCEGWEVKPADIWFVDDLLDNLRPVQETGARVALAAWGYNTPEERQVARDEGIPVLELGSVARTLCAS